LKPKAEVKVDLPDIKVPEIKTDKLEKILETAIARAFLS